MQRLTCGQRSERVTLSSEEAFGNFVAREGSDLADYDFKQ